MHCYNIHTICTMFTLRELYLEVSDTAGHPYDPWSVETPPVHPPYILDLRWVWADCGKDFHPPPKPSENTCPYHRDCACEWKRQWQKDCEFIRIYYIKRKREERKSCYLTLNRLSLFTISPSFRHPLLLALSRDSQSLFNTDSFNRLMFKEFSFKSDMIEEKGWYTTVIGWAPELRFKCSAKHLQNGTLKWQFNPCPEVSCYKRFKHA